MRLWLSAVVLFVGVWLTPGFAQAHALATGLTSAEADLCGPSLLASCGDESASQQAAPSELTATEDLYAACPYWNDDDLPAALCGFDGVSRLAPPPASPVGSDRIEAGASKLPRWLSVDAPPRDERPLPTLDMAATLGGSEPAVAFERGDCTEPAALHYRLLFASGFRDGVDRPPRS